jgi:hypothetical protein
MPAILARHPLRSAVLLLAWALPAAAHNGAVAVAAPLAGIVVDGDPSDWPADLPTYPIELAEYGAAPLGPQDYRGWFRVGFDPDRAVVYLLVEVRDDSFVADRSPTRDWYTEDGCEIYLDPVHPDSSVATQYLLRGADGVGGPRATPGSGDRVGFARADGLTRYEWAIGLTGLGPEGLRRPRTVALDAVVCDRDQDRSFSWMAWGQGTDKTGDPGHRGDLVLAPDLSALGRLTGTVRSEAGGPARFRCPVRAVLATDPSLWVRL